MQGRQRFADDRDPERLIAPPAMALGSEEGRIGFHQQTFQRQIRRHLSQVVTAGEGDDAGEGHVEARVDGAPREVPVHRKEVYLSIQKENIEAAKGTAADLDKVDELRKLMEKSGRKKEPKGEKGKKESDNGPED